MLVIRQQFERTCAEFQAQQFSRALENATAGPVSKKHTTVSLKNVF